MYLPWLIFAVSGKLLSQLYCFISYPSSFLSYHLPFLLILVKKGKCSFYIAQYPVRWTAQSAFTLFAFPDRPVHSNANSASPGSILATLQLRGETKSITFPPLSIARYSFIQRSQLGCQWRERKGPIMYYSFALSHPCLHCLIFTLSVICYLPYILFPALEIFHD